MKSAIYFSIFHWQRWMCFGLTLLSLCTVVSAQDAAKPEETVRRLGEIDIVRIKELHHITDTFGDEIWPGFDTRKIPVAINNDDKEELLVGHPDPPNEFHTFGDFELNGQPAMIRDGVSRYGPSDGGWAVEIGGKHSAYVSKLKAGRDTERYLSLILHECFHCFQRDFRQRAEGAHGNLPEDDPVYSAMIGLESRVLKATLDEQEDQKARDSAKLFVAVRHERRKQMPQNLVILEGESEYNEGTATYSQARMYQLLVEKGGITPLHKGNDPQYHGFPNAKREYARMLSRIVPPTGMPITFFHSMYQHGMAQCLVLDRVRPGWKEELRNKGMTQFALLEQEFPLDKMAEKKLLAEAKERFDYGDLLAEQKKLVDERLDLVRGYIDAPGRLYRIYHGEIAKGFKWKPVGPVYHVPVSLEMELVEKRRQANEEVDEPQHARTVWAGGIRRFEKEGLLFESGNTPVVFGHEYIEWFDPKPAPDDSDMLVESESEEDGAFVSVKIKTKGFTLEVKKARVDWSKDVVQIYPISK